MCNKVFEDTSQPFSKKNPPEHLRMSEEERKMYERNLRHQSKFDMDPEEVNIATIKNILVGEDRVERDEDDQSKKPINRR